MINNKKKYFSKISLVLLVLLAFSSLGFAQNLTGSVSVLPNSTETYTFNNGMFYSYDGWNITGGSLVSNTESGTSYSVVVSWGSSGSGSVAFKEKNVIKETLVVTIEDNAPSLITERNYVHNTSPRTPTTDIDNLLVTEKVEAISYFDGLGRPVQQVAIRAGGNREDIITHVGYDEFGRQVKDYLPYSSSTDIGSYRPDGLTATHTYYDAPKYEADFPSISAVDINPYSEKEFDNSPLNRVMKQAAPGEDWKLGNNHEIEIDYLTNTATDVRYYSVNLTKSTDSTVVTYNPSLNMSGYYGANQLYKTITKDENHDGTPTKDHTTEEFKNKQGQVILKRTYNNETKHDTYYVYDDYGNLTYVLPPKSEPHSAMPDATELSELCYQYKYDKLNRLVEKKIPGKGWEFIVYNKLDQPILTQDANLDSQNKWLFTKYDVFGRVAYTGFITSGSSRSSLQAAANAVSNTHVTKQNTSTNLAGTTIYYNNTGYPTTNITELYTINYYDNYTFDKVAGNSETAYGITPTTAVTGLATGSKVRVLGTDSWITTVSYYDDNSRPIYVYNRNLYLNTTDKVKSQLLWDGRVVETTTSHTKYDINKVTSVTTIDKFEYDHANRLVSHKQKINNAALDEVIISNIYDDLGQLEAKGVGGKENAKRLQEVDYSYNVRGWLKTINDPSIIGNDLFAFKLNYNTKDHGGNELYNGNISETEWKTKNDNVLRWYKYDYDDLNRITSGIASNNDYSLTSVGYDKNGNITDLARRGHTDEAATSFDVMDDLVYTYENKSNRLKKVIDNENGTYGFKDGSNIATEYTYDSNGNMLRDYNKGISTDILYNHLNLPTQVTLPDGRIDYIYDATGVKQKKIVESEAGEIITTYASNLIYENGSLKFMSHSEGYAEPIEERIRSSRSNSNSFNNNTTVTVTPNFKYVYQYKDHLSNVRLSYSDSNNDGSVDSSEIIEEKNYYPFGLEHKGYNNIVSANSNSAAQKYKYNGKELNDELGLDWYDYGARNYDAALGRWFVIDPKAGKFDDFSPYHYAYNRPTSVIDPDGQENIVISGGEYDSDSRYKYNFIESALNQLTSYAKQDEATTWLLVTTGYSKKDIKKFKKAAKKLGVSFVGVDSKEGISNYLNSKSTSDGDLSDARTDDKITDISAFGHGLTGSMEFGYGQEGAGVQDGLSFGISDIAGLNAGAFDNATICLFTCNAATPTEGDASNTDATNPGLWSSFAGQLATQTNSSVYGYQGRSDYAKMNQGESTSAKINRNWNGFNTAGSYSLPTGGTQSNGKPSKLWHFNKKKKSVKE
ncbi:DUF6443 domain-containing protein [uncultured Winogradskyella sp.]|uniref:DUF6443 domain-containing protein n=1 Tax=uncultured Winogradskyella sp. TaxID=395353 RepID=UPI0026303F81|nr:DUF6443 domain-containing protein [uncultured Winogradskyella sp.]